jgi:hypothetical protein
MVPGLRGFIRARNTQVLAVTRHWHPGPFLDMT